MLWRCHWSRLDRTLRLLPIIMTASGLRRLDSVRSEMQTGDPRLGNHAHHIEGVHPGGLRRTLRVYAARHRDRGGGRPPLDSSLGRPTDWIHVAYGYGLFTGGLGARYVAEGRGCTVIPGLQRMTERQCV